MKKVAVYLTILLVVVCCTSVFAQGADVATMEASGIYRAFKKLAYSVSGICAMIGAMKVYSKYANGDPDMKRGTLAWLGGAFFVALVPSVLDALFH